MAGSKAAASHLPPSPVTDINGCPVAGPSLMHPRIAVLLGVLALYVNPLRSYWSTLQESKARGAEAAALERENKRLTARKNELRDPRALEREARRLGMVRPGEKAFIVEGLPRDEGR